MNVVNVVNVVAVGNVVNIGNVMNVGSVQGNRRQMKENETKGFHRIGAIKSTKGGKYEGRVSM